MMKVRRMLTEVLLEVTDSEVHSIARDVYNKSRAQASKGINTTKTRFVHWPIAVQACVCLLLCIHSVHRRINFSNQNCTSVI